MLGISSIKKFARRENNKTLCSFISHQSVFCLNVKWKVSIQVPQSSIYHMLSILWNGIHSIHSIHEKMRRVKSFIFLYFYIVTYSIHKNILLLNSLKTQLLQVSEKHKLCIKFNIRFCFCFLIFTVKLSKSSKRFLQNISVILFLQDESVHWIESP